ncbi:reverse transcriptase domain-containing protein [Tanacetum coccineum]
MREGTFLGYKVNADGLMVCSDKVEAVLGLPSPRCLKDVQRLNRKLASLNRFLSKSAKKSLPFFKILKKCSKKSDFQWTAKAEMAFKQMKKLIAELPMLAAPKENGELIIYLAAAKEAICAVLMMERDGKQVPIYFVSRALQSPKVNYTPMEKLILALSFELGEHDIHYRPRTSVKGKILVEFIVECPEDNSPDTPMEDKEELLDPWILFIDGSSCVDGSRAGLILTNPEGAKFTYALRFRFEATNNEAEYEALIAGLRIAIQIGVKNLQANVDSWLVANQVNGSCIAKEPDMIKYLDKVRALVSTFKEFSIKQVPREENKKADALSKMASTSFAHLSKQVLVEELKEKSINGKEVLAGPDKVKFLIVAVDYFTKLIEAKPVATITGAQIKKFVWENIVCKFGLPGKIISDNGKLFMDNPFKDWYEKLCICQCFAFVKHSQANDLVERANRSLGEGIKARETPFSLTYGMKAVIPVEIGMPTLRTAEQAAIQEAKSKAKMEKYYNARVRNTSFKLRDLVYRSNEASHAEDGGKLISKWEGPYEVTEALGKGAYKLRDCSGNVLPRTWNVCNL